LRLVGYDRVPATLPTSRAVPATTADDRPDRARRALAACGLAEAITFGFQSRERVAALGLAGDDRRAAPVPLKNPMSVDQAVMRTSLVPNLLAAVARNHSFGVADVAMFEVGSVFLRPAGVAADAEITGLVDEPVHACVVLAGARPAALGAGAPWDFYDLRGAVEAMLAALTERPARVVPGARSPFLHPGISARLELDGVVVGELGEVHPDVRAAFGLDVAVLVADVDLTAVDGARGGPLRQMRTIPRYPASSRDVSLLLAVDVPAARVREVIDAASQPLVETVAVLEDYRGDKLPAGHKSMLWSIAYRSAERTLTDAEVEAAHEAIVARLCTELPAQRR
ncbi:MAG: phenylalanine--tRNA ligase subunit beta, partial [Myxococcales bacterium]|nr:phenylalanine--tRNA ligase subunit beta [Myxococcales bacterium]